jgi:serine/threonine protein phosphatase PrpC
MTAQLLAFEAAKASLNGDRTSNQDRCLCLHNADTVLLALADGLGGHPRGDVAAQLLVDVCETVFRHSSKPLFDPEHFMLHCIGRAHESILRFGKRQTPPIAPRTTAVLAIVQYGTAHWSHVGDSRLYLIRDGAILTQTTDHAMVRLVRHRADEALRPRASLTRCLGGSIKPPTTTCGSPTVLQPGDILLLCSDGLWGQVSKQTMIQAFGDDSTALATSLDELLSQAASAPNSDNVTAAALRWRAPSITPADQAALIEPRTDPRLEEAIDHLQNMLQDSDQPKQ